MNLSLMKAFNKSVWVTTSVLVVMLFLTFFSSQARVVDSQSLPYCGQVPDGVGKTPPDCNYPHDVTLQCSVENVYDAGQQFLGWNVAINASTSPAENTLLQGRWNGANNAGETLYINYTDNYNYVRFLPGQSSDSPPTINVSASVVTPYHLGGEICFDIGIPGDGEGRPPEVTLTANPLVVDFNTATELSWSSQNTSSCRTSKGLSEGFDTRGQVSGKDMSSGLLYNTIFEVTCSALGNYPDIKAEVAVTINAPVATIVSLTPNPVSDGGKVTVDWTSKNADRCYATEGPGFDTGNATSGKDDSSNLSVSNSPYKFTLYCSGPGGPPDSDSRDVYVLQDEIPPTLEFLVDKPTVNLGESVRLAWRSQNTLSCQASRGVPQGFDTGGRINGEDDTLPLNSNTTFEVTCLSSGVFPPVVRSLEVRINPPVADIISTIPDPVKNNGTTVITWVSTNADYCEATEGPGFDTKGFVSGTVTSNPLTVQAPGPEYKFTLYCSGPGGRDNDSETVDVIKDWGEDDEEDDEEENWYEVLPTIYNTRSGADVGLDVPCGQLLAVWEKPADFSVSNYVMQYFDETMLMNRDLWREPASNIREEVQGEKTVLSRLYNPPNNASGVPNESGLYKYRLNIVVNDRSYLGRMQIPIATVPAVQCTADFSLSSKSIIKVRNIDVDLTKPLSESIAKIIPIVEGDSIRFRIDIVNNGTEDYDLPIYVEDNLSNLVEPVSGYNVSWDCNDECRVEVRPKPRGVDFVVVPLAGQVLSSGGVEKWSIELTAVAKSFDPGLSVYKIKNSAKINGFSVTTQPIIVFPKDSTVVNEVQ